MCIPGLDPLSLGLLAAGTAASVGGTMMQRSEQQAANAREVEARNAVLRDNLARMAVFQKQNATQQSALMNKFTPASQQQNQTDATAARDAQITGAIPTAASEAGATPPPLTGSQPQIIKSDLAGKMLGAFQTATNAAKANAALGSYNDAWANNNFGITDTARNIDTTNSLAQGQAAILPSQQDLAAASVYQPPSGFGGMLSGLGSLMAGLGGSGYAKGMV